MGVRIEGTKILVTQSLFFDDTLLFEVSTIKESKQMKNILDIYIELSSQKINSAK